MRRAFTLIELLVVMAIIAILAAVLFPVFAQAKNAVRGMVCLSGINQVGAATSLYLADYDETWFGAVVVDPLDGFPPQRPWVGYDNSAPPTAEFPALMGRVDLPATRPFRPGAIDPYAKLERIKRCPNAPVGSQTVWALNAWSGGAEYGPATKEYRTSYGLAEFVGAQDSEDERPAETLMLWEHQSFAPMCNFLKSYDWDLIPPDNAELRSHFNLLHVKGTNTLWGDGHARRLAYSALHRDYFKLSKSH